MIDSALAFVGISAFSVLAALTATCSFLEIDGGSLKIAYPPQWGPKSFQGTCASSRPSVTVKKKRKAKTAAFLEIAEAPLDLMCS